MTSQRKTTLPTEEEIANLPRWASVALGARCARRVLALYHEAHSIPVEEEAVDPIDEAIAYAENAAGMVGEGANSDIVREASSMINCIEADVRTRAAYDFEADAAKAARAAADAAGRAVQVHDAGSTRAAANAAYSAAAYTTAAAYGAAGEAATGPAGAEADPAAAEAAAEAAEEIIVKAIRLDFERLRNTAKQEKWNNQTPVPPEFFGPLWPDGEPEGWPFAKNEDPQRSVNPDTSFDAEQQLVLRTYVGEFAPEGEVVEELKKLIHALNAYHIAAGGGGLVIEDWQTFTRTKEPVEALS